MKSIVEEASTIAKAIAKAWEQADKPTQFSVKVLEEPQSNFFGMTTKSAKVGIYYHTSAPSTNQSSSSRPTPKARRRRPLEQKTSQAAAPESSPRKGSRSSGNKYDRPQQSSEKSYERSSQYDGGVWTKEMSDEVKRWLIGVLSARGTRAQVFKTQIDGPKINIIFSEPFTRDKEKERLLFSSFAHLISKMLFLKFGADARNLKIALQSGNA